VFNRELGKPVFFSNQIIWVVLSQGGISRCG